MTLINSKPRLWVYSGTRPSNSAKELAAQPGFLRLRDDRFHKVRKTDVVINWGVSKPLPKFDEFATTVNGVSAICKATDKLQSFYAMENFVSTVPFTEDTTEALGWCKGGNTVIVRNKLTGHSGDGIVIIEKGTVNCLQDMMKYEAPLYTKYIFKDEEYRVHVVKGQVVDTQKKIRDPNQEPKTWKVRSHANGFLFARNGITPCENRNHAAKMACTALGLDFGAVDLICKGGIYYVLEVNTAPGLEGQTVINYANALREAFQIAG